MQERYLSCTGKAALGNGETSIMNGIDLFRIDDEKIQEVWLFSSKQQIEDNYWA